MFLSMEVCNVNLSNTVNYKLNVTLQNNETFWFDCFMGSFQQSQIFAKLGPL